MFGKAAELKKIYDKYELLKKEISKLLIVGREGDYIYKDDDGNKKKGDVLFSMNGKSEVKEFKILNKDLLNEENKEKLEELIKKCITKTQQKVQEEITNRTEKLLGFDPSKFGDIGNVL